MLNLHYSMVDNCTVLAYDPQSKTEKWRRSLRTYFRNTQKFPMITLHVQEGTVMAAWMGSYVIMESNYGTVEKFYRAMVIDGTAPITII